MTVTTSEVPVDAQWQGVPAGHIVQFYEHDQHLAAGVADYLADGLSTGERGLMIATAEHATAIESGLQRRGASLAQLHYADARETLASIVLGDQPDDVSFRAVIGGLLDRIGSPLRIYGEMVDLLWRDGSSEAALRLEALWNELLRERGFQLLCGYAMGNFNKESQSAAFDAICHSHGVVIPAESSTTRELAALQQRALALEAEIARRKRLEEERQFLLDVTTALNRALEYEARLRDVAELAVPRLGDVCIVEVAGEDHAAATIRAGAPNLESRALDAITVPLTVGGRTFGKITLCAADRRYDDHDHALATDFARRAAMALENAHLYEVARQANRTKDEFLATLSHELRTPLTAILGWSHMLTLGGLDPETMHVAIETIDGGARTQAALIDAMLDVSRIVTGKMTLQSELVDLGTVVGSAVQTVRLAADAKKIRIDVNGTATRTVVAGDPTRLQQIVWNLLANAIKFTGPHGRVVVTIDRDTEQGRITIRDDGCGIPAEFLPHVFQPFRQADDSAKRIHGGLGLGLAIVKYLAELHGGHVTAGSDGAGKGSTFVVTLPLATRRDAVPFMMSL